MAFRLHHSLASRAAVSVVVSLWYHEDIDSLKRFNGYFETLRNLKQSPFDRTWFCVDSTNRARKLSLQKSVTDNVSTLPIPENLKECLLEFVQMIGENLEDWIGDHFSPPQKLTEVYGQECFAGDFFELAPAIRERLFSVYGASTADASIDVDLRRVLRWNPDGEIDLEQTGEALVQGEVNSIKRFRLACVYCKEDEMLLLWPTVRFHFSSPEAWVGNIAQGVSALFWRRYFHCFWPRPISTYLFHLESSESVAGGSILMAEVRESLDWKVTHRCSPLTLYLLNAIRQDHAQPMSIIGGEAEIADKRYGPILFRMPESYQAQILRDFPKGVFKQLLFWRHQSFFVDTVERSWETFDADLFDSILSHIARGVEEYASSAIYRRVFLRYWTGSPSHLRDVERILYVVKIEPDPRAPFNFDLGVFVEGLFGRPSAGEERVKRALFEGRHVLQLLMGVRTRHVMYDLIRECCSPEECDEKLEMVDKYFQGRAMYTMYQSATNECLIS